MNTKSKIAIVAGAALLTLALAAEARANHILGDQTVLSEGLVAELIEGNPNCGDVVKICELQSKFVELFIANPKNNATTTYTVTDGVVPFQDTYEIQVTIAASKVGFHDQSLDASFGTDALFPDDNQRTGTPGVDAVIVRSGSNANVYCRPNLEEIDVIGGLVPPGGNVSQIRFCWSRGPCLLDNSDVTAVCDVYNPDSNPAVIDLAHVVQGHFFQAQSEVPIDLCGCNEPIRFCDVTLSPDKQGACGDPTQANLTGLDSQSSATTGDGTCAWITIRGVSSFKCF